MRTSFLSVKFALPIVVVTCLLCLACQKLAVEKRAQPPSESSAMLADVSPGPEGGNQRGLTLVSAQEASVSTPRKIIRNGSLELTVADVNQATTKIRAIVEGLGGFIEKSSQTNVGGHTAT
jgi:hypothetical protein